VKSLLQRLLSPVRRHLAGAAEPLAAPPDGARVPPEDTGQGIRLEDLRVESNGPVETGRLPRVTIIIPNHNGRHHFARCFASLTALDYPKAKLEVILVDNGSVDGSVEEMRDQHAWVRLVANERNEGFTGGCNQGARLTEQAEVLVFLNNDVRVEEEWLRELVSPIVRGECDATTAKLYSWDGKLINAAGGGMNFHGIGIQQGYGEAPTPEHDVPRLSLFAHGAAMAIRAPVFHDVGGFDPEFFAYYEDVDLGWRMWVLGHKIHYVPGAVCYHHHSSTSQTFPPETLRLLQVRNPVYACFKNYDDENMRRVLPAIIALSVRRMLLISGIASDRPFRIEHATAERAGALGKLMGKAREAFNPEITIRRAAAADLIAINDFLGNWDHWMKRRAEVQSRRKRSDAEIFRLFLKPMWCVEEEKAYRRLQEGMASFMGIDEMFGGLSIPGADPKK
jgi:GT2 family glycosyltransferase